MSTKTTIRLRLPQTAPLPDRPLARRIAGAVVAGLVLFAFAADALERRAASVPAMEATPQIIILIATPTPMPPTAVPTLAPTAVPPPTPEPVIIYQEVPIEVPVPVYVPAAPEPAPATYSPPTEAPAVIGEIVTWDGETVQVAP